VTYNINVKNQRIIAFCGPDMCGKTQIAIELSKRTGIPYFKATGEHTDFLLNPERFIQSLRYSDTRTLDLFQQCGYSIILDRCWACEYVYSKVLNRKTDLKVLKNIDNGFARLGAEIIITQRSSYEGIVDDLDPGRLRDKKLQQIHDTYQEFATWTSCNVIHLNVDDENIEREIAEINNKLFIS
jgi:hypothetical protein